MPTLDEKRKKIFLWVIVIAIIFFGIGGLLVFSYYYNNRCYTKYQVVSETARSDSNNVTYQYFQKNLLKFSQSGISLIDTKGKTLWNGGFEMKQAQVDRCGEQVIAADVGGNSFHIYNGKDEGVGMETTYPIVRAKVSAQGVAAVLEQDTDSNSLKVYNPYANTNKLLIEIPSNVSEEGYPLDFDISPDGTSLVATYMTVDGNEAKWKVNFYNFSDVGQDKNLLVGGKEYDTEMVAGISFMDDDHVVIYHEKGFDIYNGMKEPKITFSQSFENQIVSIAQSDKYIGVITTDGSQKNKELKMFTTTGENILSCPITYEYTDFNIYGEELYFNSSHHIDIMRINGTPKFECDFDVELTGVFPGGRSIEYIVVDHQTIKRIRMKAR